ncbi:MAG: alpha/beta hydrolase, partial [Pseudomonadota bacterium]
MTQRATGRRAPLIWTLTEGRGLFDLGSFRLLKTAMQRLPRGDGHCVLVLPGFLAGDGSTRPLRGLLRDLGYDAQGWGMGQNLRFNAERDRQMMDLVERVYAQKGRKISLIGWSLGGVFAREIAKGVPEKVRCVITLGSPISNERAHSNARNLFEAINGKSTTPLSDGRYQDLEAPPPVPTTSIFTKMDGVVNWRGSVQKPGGETENICLPSSHLGIGVSPLTMVAIADRLIQPEGDWMPFDRSGW